MKKILLFTVLILVMSACSAKTSPKLSDTIEIAKGKAVIYFFRPNSMGGAAINFHVHNENNKPVGFLANGDSFYITVEPGRHHFWARAVSKNDLYMTVEADKMYFVKGYTKMGLVVGRPTLVQVREKDVK